jgi:GTP-binding protein
VGKSSLINNLLKTKITKDSKSPGKTQRLEFFSINDELFLIDAPGFGFVDGPIVLRRKFKYLIYTYINYAVRLNHIIYLINGEHGLQKVDIEEIKFLNNFNKHIQLVFTKVDSFSDKNIIKHVTHASNFSKDLANVRQEILLTSSKTGYGLENLRTHIYLDIKL